jgi:hypothetical protein
MPSFQPGVTYIIAVLDAKLVKLRIDGEFPDESVLVGPSDGSPEGLIVGSPGDIRIDFTTPAVWQKQTGELTVDGWAQLGTGGGGADPDDPFVTFAVAGDLPNARVLTAGPGIAIDLSVPGQAIIDNTASAPQFSGTFDTVGATSVTVPLADLTVLGSNAIVRNLFLSMVFRAPNPGDIGQINYNGVAQAQTGPVDGTVLFGPPPWGPPPGVPEMNSTGYQSVMTFGSPGGVGCDLQVTGSQLEILVTIGFGGFTIRHNYAGDLFVFDGAVRLHP